MSDTGGVLFGIWILLVGMAIVNVVSSVQFKLSLKEINKNLIVLIEQGKEK